jgi:hypothetical protein
MSENPGLVIRRHRRHDIALDAEVSIAPEHAQAVRFAPAVGGRRGQISTVLVDVSSGGLGVISTVFIPRGALAFIRVRNPAMPDAPPVLDAKVRVQRVTMTDRRPGYLIGASFADTSADFVQQFERFMAILEGDSTERTDSLADRGLADAPADGGLHA